MSIDRGTPLATLIHISDLHFGSSLKTDPGAIRRFIARIPFVGGLAPHSYAATRALALRVGMLIENRQQRKIPVCVAFTGDLTRGGEPQEFITASTFLKGAHIVGDGKLGLELINRKTIRPGHVGLFSVPGNHDIWRKNDPQKTTDFEGFFPEKFPTMCRIESVDRPVYLFGLDSNRNSEVMLRLARGKVPLEHLDQLCDILGEHQHAVKVVCIHHPLRDPQRWKRDPTMWLDDRELIGRRLFEAGVHLVLSGHIHTTAIIEKRNADHPHLVIAGTALQLYQETSFLMIDIHSDGLNIRTFIYNPANGQFDSGTHLDTLEF